MKLYYHPLSSNARRARLVAHHLGLAVEEVLVDLTQGAHKQPAYLALNPNGKVPTLVDGDLKLWESYAIMIYLCEKAGRHELLPQGLSERTEVNRWLFWCANEWSPVIARINFENLIKPMLGHGQPDPVRVQEAETTFKALATLLDAHLEQRSYVAGSGLTLADFALAASLSTAVPAKLPIAAYKSLLAWFARIQQLPAWVATSR